MGNRRSRVQREAGLPDNMDQSVRKTEGEEDSIEKYILKITWTWLCPVHPQAHVRESEDVCFQLFPFPPKIVFFFFYYFTQSLNVGQLHFTFSCL